MNSFVDIYHKSTLFILHRETITLDYQIDTLNPLDYYLEV